MEYILDRCQAQRTSTVIFNPMVSVDSYSKAICPNDNETTVDISIDGDYDRYFWKELNSSLQTVSIDSSGTYNFVVFNTFNCSDSGSAVIQFVPAPLIDVENFTACEGDTVYLVGKPSNISNVSNATYQWSYNGLLINIEDSIIEAKEVGLYHFKYSVGECQRDVTSNVVINPSPDAVGSFSQLICADNGETADIAIEGSYTKCYWHELNDSSQTVGIDSAGIYNFSVFNKFNCPNQGVATITEACPPQLHLPTIFTPGAETNNWMIVKGMNVDQYDLKIFNRWGEIIFHTNDTDDYWDGNWRDEEMPIGVYNWSVRYTGNSVEYYGPYFVKGVITIKR